jgi:hypothetical protein
MKDQDYIKIMDRISKNKIEEAFTWDASAQKNRRSIRRLSLGIGTIAAAIAVVIGGISYNYRDRLHANPGDESSDAQYNFFCGQGEIKGFVGTDGNMLFRDDNNYYLPIEYSSDGSEVDYLQWSVNGSTGTERHTHGGGRLLTDGEQLYFCLEHKLITEDSYGNGTLFSAVPWQPCTIRKLCDGQYFLSAFVEDSWLDGEPKPYVILNLNGSPLYQFVDYGNVCSDGKNLYYSDFSNQIYAAPLNDIQNASIVADLTMREDYKQTPQWSGQERPEQELQEWLIKDDCIYSIHSSPAASDPVSLMCTQLHGDSDSCEPMMLRETTYPYSDAFQKTHLLNDRMYQFSVKYKLGNTVLISSDLDCTEETDYFVVESESLWETDPTGEMSDFILFDTGEHIIFTLPKEGKNGEQIVQVNKETGEYQYFGENYAPEQPQTAEQTDAVQASAEDSTETNFLGGKGKLRLFRHTAGYYLNAEDDTYFYDLSNSMRARKTGGDTEYEAFTLPGLTETDAEQHFFITDGMNLVSLDDVLYEINPDGSLSEVLSMAEVTEDQYGNPTENIRFSAVAGFSQDASGRPTKLSLYLTGHTIGDPYVPQGPIGRAILNLKTGELSYMESFSILHETVIVSENAVYSGIMAGAKPQLQTAQLRKYSDGDTYDLIDTSGWDFGGNLISVSEDDGTVTFMNRNSQYCKGNLKDGSCTVIADVPTDILCNILPTVVLGTQKIICTTGSNKRVILCNPDGSDQIILKQAGASAQQLITRGVYIENGVIHLTVAEMFPPASGSQMPGEIDHVITIDGDNVSSYAITAP